MSREVFVYGTLKPGQSRWQVLAPFAVRASSDIEDSASGRLFDTGFGWPAAVFAPDVDDRVPGVVITLAPDSVDDALAVLDEVEGVDSGLFRRVLIDVDGRPCWTYHWPGTTEGFQRIDSWPPQ